MSGRSNQRLKWRRDKVRELSDKGYSQRDIASELKVSQSLVFKDIRYLREQSKNNIQHYIDERLPAEYEGAINTLNMITKEMWELKTSNNRELIQARQLIKECTAMKVELIASGTVVDRAIKFVDRHRDLMTQNNKVAIDEDDIDARSIT